MNSVCEQDTAPSSHMVLEQPDLIRQVFTHDTPPPNKLSDISTKLKLRGPGIIRIDHPNLVTSAIYAFADKPRIDLKPVQLESLSHHPSLPIDKGQHNILSFLRVLHIIPHDAAKPHHLNKSLRHDHLPWIIPVGNAGYPNPFSRYTILPTLSQKHTNPGLALFFQQCSGEKYSTGTQPLR